MDGIVLIDKPAGMTSHDVVAQVRRRFDMRRVGHAGTLDPMATGLLVILLGKSTKLFKRFEAFDKAYNATLLLGTTTDTADISGKVLQEKPFASISRQQLEEVFAEYTGDIKQVPPMVSAVKVNGQRLYKLARRGVQVPREPRRIKIKLLKVVEFILPHVKFYLECSKGTYVRKLAEDVGEELNCGACISQIERSKVGIFSLQDAVKLEDLSQEHVRAWN